MTTETVQIALLTRELVELERQIDTINASHSHLPRLIEQAKGLRQQKRELEARNPSRETSCPPPGPSRRDRRASLRSSNVSARVTADAAEIKWLVSSATPKASDARALP